MKKRHLLIFCLLVASIITVGSWRKIALPEGTGHADQPDQRSATKVEEIERKQSWKKSFSDVSEPQTPVVVKDWLTALKPLSKEEEIEVQLVPDQVKKFLLAGKMDPEKVDEFRGVVFKYDERLLAHAGRVIVLEGTELAKTKEGAESLVALIDMLGYFAARNDDWPLAHEIIRDIATRPINFSDSATASDKSAANITIQAFEQFVRFKPEEAIEYVLTRIEKSNRQPYIAYFKTGLALSGVTKEEIEKKVTRLY